MLSLYILEKLPNLKNRSSYAHKQIILNIAEITKPYEKLFYDKFVIVVVCILNTQYSIKIIIKSIKIERPKKFQFTGDFYTLDELHLLFEKSKNDQLELVILITSFYGLRRSEVLGLKWSSIDFEKNIITIKHKVLQRNAKKNRTMLLKDKTKNKSSYRSLPLLPVIADVLKKYEKKIKENKKI